MNTVTLAHGNGGKLMHELIEVLRARFSNPILNEMADAAELEVKKGRLALIYPSTRLVDILIRMRRFNLEPKKIQSNHANLGSSAKLVMIEASIGGKPGIEMRPPLFGQPTYPS